MVAVGISVSLYNYLKNKGMLCSYLFSMDCGLLGQQGVQLTLAISLVRGNNQLQITLALNLRASYRSEMFLMNILGKNYSLYIAASVISTPLHLQEGDVETVQNGISGCMV